MTAIPSEFPGLRYTEFLASLSMQRECSKYLEIGIQFGENLKSIHVDHAIGIDPAFDLRVDPTVGKRVCSLHRMTSDAFFARGGAAEIDLAFLDGMHLFEYLLRDFYNVEGISKSTGLITMHDCLPLDDKMIVRQDVGIWTGDVWKIIPILKQYRPDLEVVCVDCSPTGLVCVTNLDPASTVLRDNYLAIVKEFAEKPNDLAALEAFYSNLSIVRAAEVLNDYRQTLYFRS